MPELVTSLKAYSYVAQATSGSYSDYLRNGVNYLSNAPNISSKHPLIDSEYIVSYEGSTDIYICSIHANIFYP